MIAPPTLDTPIPPINKATASRYVEQVRGVIIGGNERECTWAIYSKKTRNLQKQGSGKNDEDCRTQAQAWVNEQKALPGYSALFGTEGFELRIWG